MSNQYKPSKPNQRGINGNRKSGYTLFLRENYKANPYPMDLIKMWGELSNEEQSKWKNMAAKENDATSP